METNRATGDDKKVGNPSRRRKTQAWWDEHGDKEQDIIRIEGVNRLVTRNLLKHTKETDRNDIFPAGMLIWGFCRGWWPALVITPEDVKIEGNSKKLWVYWLIESKISQLKTKSQVMYFCDGDRERLVTIMNRIKDPSSHFIEIMKILGNRIECFFTQPYDLWIQKNFSSLTNYKNHLIFHPYPPSVRDNLENLRETHSNPVKANTTQRKMSVRNSYESSDKSPDKLNPKHLHVKYQQIGEIIWAKIPGQIWWPAMIIDFRDCAMSEAKLEYQWVMWYGDYTLSQVNNQFFMKFEVGMKKFEICIRQSKRELYKRGVLEACRDYCSSYEDEIDDWDLNDAFNWFRKFTETKDSTDNRNLSKKQSYNKVEKYSLRIKNELIKHISKTSQTAIREQKFQDNGLLTSLASNTVDLKKSICLMCLENQKEAIHEHPFFEGSLCKKCMIHHKSTIFAYDDDDGKCFFCALCAVTDTVVICDNPDCPRVYCIVCLKYLISPSDYHEILKTEPWHCFLCSDLSTLLTNSLARPRQDWKERIQMMFSINRRSISHYLSHYEGRKGKIRVLSLFDGISTGLLALKRLKFEVEAYFASEVDPDAEIVSKVHFGTAVTRLGDVRSITEETINHIVPIDLLIGGSPCNDLSLVNPKRRGLDDENGTGILFFDYCRIKNIIHRANKDRNLFWLFENVASMPEEYKQIINRNLGTEPDLIDSAEFSPQHRPRYYWTNIPLSSYTPFVRDLQDVLTPNCNRYAVVKKIRTVTTQMKSLKQGAKALKPIIMNEEYDFLWTTELEEIFGFPRHYTDVKNLSASKRQKLLGQSWCVRTITEIMRPLTHYFVMIEEADSLATQK